MASSRDFAGIPRVRRPRAAPTDDRVAFLWNPGDRYELFVRGVETGERRQVTDGDLHRSPNAPAVWGPDGETLYTQTGEHGYALGQIYRVAVDGRVERVATPGGGWGMLWGVDPTGSWLLSTHDADGDGQRVYRYDLDRGDATRLSQPETTVPSRGTRISPDGSRVCYPGYRSPDADRLAVHVVDANGDDPRRIPVAGDVRPQAWHPEGERLLCYDRDERRVGELALRTDEIRWFGPGQPLAYLDPETVLTAEPSLYDRETGERTSLPVDGSVGDELVGDEVLLGDRVLLTRQSDRRPVELYAADPRTGGETRLVTADFGVVDPDALVSADEVSYTSVDGRAVEALLYRPPGTEESDPTPVVVEAHGYSAQPVGAPGRGFDRKTQFLVSRGYAVLKPAYRGEKARDEGFAPSIRGDWGGEEQRDLAAAAAWVADRDWTRDDVALYGHSFGGFSVYTQLVEYPETWALGVASAGFADLFLLDAAHGGDPLLRAEMGHPREYAALWRDRSPITRLDAIARPLLVLHGRDDPTTPVSQARAVRGALEAERGWTVGEEFEYVELDRGEHGNLDAETNAQRWDLAVDFLDRRLEPAGDT